MRQQKTWFITGASRGFGLDITKAVLAAGDKAVATVRKNADHLTAAFNDNPDLLVVTLDVTNPSSAVSKPAANKTGKNEIFMLEV